MGFRVLVSLHPAIQATGRLTLAPAGFHPAEHTSLHWTHNRTCRSPASGSRTRLHALLSHATPSAVSEHSLEFIGCPISRSFTTYCVCLELRSLPSTGITQLPRYYEPLRHPKAPSLSLTGFRLVVADHALGLPVFRALSLCTCCRHYPGAATGRIASLSSPSRVSLPRYGSRVGLRIVLFEMLWGRRWARRHHRRLKQLRRWSIPMSELNDLSRSLTSLEQDKTIIAVIEMSQSSWLVAGIVPGMSVIH